MSLIQPTLTQEHKNDITDYINMYRRKHGAPPIKYDDNIATFSQSWASYLASNGLFEHSTNREYVENLAYFKGYGNNVLELIKKSIDLWYEEISLYDFKNPGFSSETGHFTCLIWKEQTSFGIGYAYNTEKDVVNVNQNVSPPCNIMGGFEDNVLPLLEETPTTPIVEEPVEETPTTPIVEEPDEEDIETTEKELIHLLENVLNLIKGRQRRRVILHSLNIIIDELILDKENMYPKNVEKLNMLYYTKYLLETGKPLYFVFHTVRKIIHFMKSTL